jgi:hypothetical protein
MPTGRLRYFCNNRDLPRNFFIGYSIFCFVITHQQKPKYKPVSLFYIPLRGGNNAFACHLEDIISANQQ